MGRLLYEFSMIFAKASFAMFLMEILMLVILVLAVIGLISTIKYFSKRKHAKETDGQYWLRTGRTRDKK